LPERNPFESLRKKIVLVTGATGGLGKAVVKRLLDAGAVVAAVYRTEDRLQGLVDFLGGERTALGGFRADLTQESEVTELVDAVLKHYGRIDALLNLAGGWRGGADVAATSLDDWDTFST